MKNIKSIDIIGTELDNYSIVSPGINTGIREPDIVTGHDSRNYSILANSLQEMAQNMVDEYTMIYESIKQYDGFYIGRYELTGTVENPTLQKGQKVLTADIAGNWYQLKKACTNLIQTGQNISAQSTMIYGNQWDEVLDWLEETGSKTFEQINEDSSRWGNYNDYNTANNYTEDDPEYVAEAGTMVLPAGSSEYWKANNIYDLAGNARDWTQEANTTLDRVRRGGSYSGSGSGGPVADRGNNNSSDSLNLISARPVLYITLSSE